MAGPSWLAATFAVIMLAVAVYCAARLVVTSVTRRRAERDVDLVHLGMGVAMAAMFVPSRNPLAGAGWDVTWTVVFSVALVWFVVRAAVGQPGPAGDNPAAHFVPHAVHSGAMVYMLTVMSSGTPGGGMPAMPAMPGMGAAGPVHLPTLALVLALFMVGYTVLVADHVTLLPADGPGPAAAPPSLAPRSAAVYKIATSIGMAYMLVTLL